MKIVILFFIFIISSMALELSQEEKAWLEKHPEIRVGIDGNWPPFEYIEEGKYKGISSEFLKILQKKLGVKFRIVESKSWEETLKRAKYKEIDIIPTLIRTKSRENFFHFTKPYISFPMVLITRDNFKKVEGFESFMGKKVAVVKDYASKEFIKAEYPFIKFTQFENVTEAIKAVSDGRTDLFVENLSTASFVIKQSNITNLKISGTSAYNFNVSFGVRKDWALFQNILQKGLDDISDNEKLRLREKWIFVTYEKTHYKEIFIGIAIASSLLMLFIYMRYKRLKITLNIVKENESELLHQNEELEKIAMTDHLTKIANRARFELLFRQEIEQAKRYKNDLSLVFFDIDHFKKINDKHGHDVGDEVLKEMAKLVETHIRKSDVFARWGGEEFVLVTPNTNLTKAKEVAEKLRKLIEAHAFENVQKLTCSFGVSSHARADISETMIKRADEALYLAKKKGRNCVVVKEA